MAKPLKIMIEVEEIMFGKIFRLLDSTSGVVAITPIGDGPKSPSTRGQKKGGTQSVACLVLEALIKTPKLSREQLYPVLEGSGKRRTSLPDTLQKLKQAGEIRASGAGKGVTYRITTVGKKRYDTACAIEGKE
jgi:hypothetical protein